MCCCIIICAQYWLRNGRNNVLIGLPDLVKERKLSKIVINRRLPNIYYTPPHFSGEVLCYTLPCLSVRPSVRAHHFRSITWSIYSRIFFKFCIHIVIGDEWYGIVNGQNPSIFNGVTALFRIGKMVSGLLFLYCS